MGVAKLHANSHLYTSGKLINGFPGRRYRLLESLPVKEFARRYKGRKINLSTRNFPASADALQKKYRLTQAGDDHAFFTTIAQHANIRGTGSLAAVACPQIGSASCRDRVCLYVKI